MRSLSLIGALALVVAGLSSARVLAAERSPFDMVRLEDDGPRVQLDGTWYELVSLDGLTFEQVRAACVAIDSRNWPRRFCEDLDRALSKAGHPPGPTVDLVLRDVATGERVERAGVAMTEARREAIKQARPWRAVRRVKREHAAEADPRFAFLTKRLRAVEPGASVVPGDKAREDLDQLEWLIESTYAYRDRAGLDYRAAFDTVRAGLGDGIVKEDFDVQLIKLVALFGDGHARVQELAYAYLPGYAPFEARWAQGRVVALDAEGKPLDAAHPYLAAIDGVKIESWLEAAMAYRARGTPQYRRRSALRTLVRLNHLRAELGLEAKPDVVLRLADPGEKTVDRNFDVAVAPVRREPVRPQPRELEGGFAYVPIPEMRLNFGKRVAKMVEAVAGAPGIVLDVRGNGGGTRHILRDLMPHLMPADSPPAVVNVAALRLPPYTHYDPVQGLLADRFLYPPTARLVPKSSRPVAESFVKGFRCAFEIDRSEFTPWHLLIIEPAAEKAWRYAGPVVVLIDEGCFSATDIFVGALETLPDVTLIGTTTSGGSGRAKEFRLANTRIGVRLSTMVSARPDGRLYDGRGIAPDIEVERTLADVLGERDSALERAVEHLRTQTR